METNIDLVLDNRIDSKAISPLLNVEFISEPNM